ncbi:MAG: hypothetical protein Q9211_001034 [Gyalolechia sp. 1 TL-2023]
MAEFAAAASAAGLASLGIQCCKGLTTYYSSYKAYDKQIGAIFEQIQVLTAFFVKLERVLSRNAAYPSQASSLQQVDGILTMCRGRLQKLQSVLDQCQSVTLPNSTSVSLQKIKARALFPFREQTLLTLRENVQSLRGDLHFALSVLQIDLEMEQNQSIASLAAVSRNVEVASQTTQSAMQAMATPVHRMDTGFDLLLQQGQDTTTRLSEMQVQAHHYHEAALDLYRHIPEQCRQLLQRDQRSSHSLEQDLVTGLGQLGTERELLREEIRSLNQTREGEAKGLAMTIDVLNETIKNLQLVVISRPSLLPSADRENSQLGNISHIAEPNVDAGQGSLYNPPRRRMKCNCDARYTNVPRGEALSTRRSGRLFGHGWIYRFGMSSTQLHRRTCPMFSTSSAVVTARLSISICGALLRGAAEASFSIIRGAGGFSISPALNCMRVVDGNTETFSLVASLDEDCPVACRIDWEYRLSRRIQKIERLFREGQASPYDVDLEGKTLLHTVGKYLDDWHIRSLGKQTSLSQEVILRSLVTFCENLHNLGLPLNWHSHEGGEQRLFVDQLIHMPPAQLDSDVLSHSLNRLCEIGLELTSSAFTTRGLYYYCDGDVAYLNQEVMPASPFQKCDDVINALSHNEIHAAVLNRSVPDLRAALQRSRTSVDEPNEMGHTPLHLAFNWPCGLLLLLAHGADMEKTSRSGHKPVEYAIMHGCTEGVELLLKAGCSFESDAPNISSMYYGRYGSKFWNIFVFAVRYLTGDFAVPRLHGNYLEIVKIIIDNLALRKDTVSKNAQILTSDRNCHLSSKDEKKIISTWLLRWLFENVPSKDFPISTVEPEEANEIRDEDRDGIQLLESLLPEFEEKLGDGDIESFIDGYWSTRMEEVLAARDEEPVDRAGMREAGVFFCDDDASNE